MEFDVAIVGTGRVGLPLALAFADRGLKTLGVDSNPRIIDCLQAGKMPFFEPQADDILAKVQGNGKFAVAGNASQAANARYVVLTLGTPSFSHIEIDVRQIRSVLDDLVPNLQHGQTVVLRSTIAPGTTSFVAGYIEQQRPDIKVGRDVFVAHVPERIAASQFFAEISSLPCIIGGIDEASGAKAEELFRVLGAEIVQTSAINAELAKIWTNILRYTMFALPNRLMMECEQYDADVFQVIKLINRDYPRGGMKLPGMTAGTCLRKDFTFSEERSPAPGMLLAVSRVNESVPLFLVEGLKKRQLNGSLRGKKVAVLGLAFKADTDDERDSLSFKLIRLLERELALVAAHDPVSPSSTLTLSEATSDADAIIMATNHSSWCNDAALSEILSLAKQEAVVADPWNCFEQNLVFATSSELQSSSSAHATSLAL